MSKIRYMKKEYNALLKNDIDESRYNQNKIWINNHFDGKKWYGETNVDFEPISLKISSDSKDDFDNAIKFFQAYKNISPSQASKEHLWSYLTHSTFYDYMQVRWSLSNSRSDNIDTTIKRRYFFHDLPYIKNGIARLWWIPYMTYDESRDNPFELTEYIFKRDQNIAQEFFTRKFSNNKTLVKDILSILVEINWRPTVNEMRDFATYLNNRSGMLIIDFLDKKDLKKLITDYIDKK